MTNEAQASVSDYPVSLDIDYTGDGRNRLTVFFRVVTLIPIVLVQSGIAVIIWPLLLMILFKKKYPRWWFDFNLELTRFSTRVGAYWMLLTDEYPATDEEQSTHLTLEYPDASQLSRWLPLFKWILLVPHYIVLWVLFVVMFILVVVGWFSILITGKFPRSIHKFVVGVSRWSLRVQAYGFLLITDKYPPFSLD